MPIFNKVVFAGISQPDALNFTMPGGGTITLNKVGSPNEVTLEYSLDKKKTWTEWTETDSIRTLNLSSGQTAYIRNTSETSTSFSTGLDDYYNFSFSATTTAGGNIDSLLCTDPKDAIITNYCYSSLFKDCTTLASCPNIPSIELAPFCYMYMFMGSKIIQAPVLPATRLASSCYLGMFMNCNSLKSVYDLEATSLYDSCYKYMFKNCEKLESSPRLYAETLVNHCYEGMFQDCIMLKNVCTNMLNIQAEDCLLDWLSNISNAHGGDFYCNDLLEIPIDSSNGIPDNWLRHPESDQIPINFIMPEGGQILLTATDRTDEGYSTPNKLLEYSVDEQETWQIMPKSSNTKYSLNVNAGERVYFRRFHVNHLNYSRFGSSNMIYTFSFSSTVYADGNVNSLLCQDPGKAIVRGYSFYRLFSSCTTLVTPPKLPSCGIWGDNCYNGMFRNCSSLISAPELPAKDLYIYNSCYREMFSGCSSIVEAPVLPATIISMYCYANMFSGCTSLKTVSTLPAKKANKYCYNNMFSGCTSLEVAPDILLTQTSICCCNNMFGGCTSLVTPPTRLRASLSTQCYSSMFEGCTSLTSPPDMYPAQPANECYSNMFKDCSSLTSVPELNAVYLSNRCYASMFENCVSIEEAPVFYIEKIGSTSCYNRMFYGCSNLHLIILNVKDSCFSFTSWVEDVSETGIFYCDPNSDFEIGPNGIPEGWIRYDLPLNFKMINGGSITLTKIGNPNNVNLQYSLDGLKTWNDWSEENGIYTVSLIEGQRIYIRNASTINTRFSLDENNYYQFGFSDQVISEGNVNSLLCENARNAILTPYCFYNLFKDCTSLTSLPQLLSDNLATSCYNSMFYNCTSLNSVVSLQAEILADSCYKSMFYNCTSLTSVGEINGLILAQNCYNSMFYNCVNLSQITTRMVDISATDCLTNWLYGVSGLGDFYCSDSLAILQDSASGIPLNWTKHNIDILTPLNFYSQEGAAINFNRSTDFYNFEYSKDGCVTWVKWPETGNPSRRVVSIGAGETVYIRTTSDSSIRIAENSVYSYRFSFSNYVEAHGNVNSLTNKFPNLAVLSPGGYSGLFKGSKYITTAPDLPSTILSDSCYYEMFAECTGLISIPDLPATVLTNKCYSHMFSKCSSLTAASNINAVEMATDSCEYMFSECTSLVTPPELPATILAPGCYTDMFYKCKSLVTPPELPATTLATGCYQFMFFQCNSLTAAPVLVASNLEGSCYRNMFSMCTNISYIKTYMTEVSNSSNSSIYKWLEGANSSGDFYCLPSLSIERSTSGIPSGWTRHDIEE